MRYATFLSAVLHVGVAAASLIAWPFLKPIDVPYKAVVPIELLSEAEVSDRLSVKADQKTETVVEEPEARDDIEVAQLPEPEPIEQPQEPTPPPPDPEPTPEPEPEPEPQEPEPEKEEPKTQPRQEEKRIDDLSDLDDVLKDLEVEEPKGAPSEVADAEGLRDQEQVGLGDKLTAAEEDLVRAAMLQCYDQPTGVPNAEELVVRIRFELDRDGELRDQPDVLNARQIALSNNSWWRATRDRAVRAVIDCQPYDYLSQDRYHIWETVILNFTPIGVM